MSSISTDGRRGAGFAGATGRFGALAVPVTFVAMGVAFAGGTLEDEEAEVEAVCFSVCATNFGPLFNF